MRELLKIYRRGYRLKIMWILLGLIVLNYIFFAQSDYGLRYIKAIREEALTSFEEIDEEEIRNGAYIKFKAEWLDNTGYDYTDGNKGTDIVLFTITKDNHIMLFLDRLDKDGEINPKAEYGVPKEYILRKATVQGQAGARDTILRALEEYGLGDFEEMRKATGYEFYKIVREPMQTNMIFDAIGLFGNIILIIALVVCIIKAMQGKNSKEIVQLQESGEIEYIEEDFRSPIMSDKQYILGRKYLIKKKATNIKNGVIPKKDIAWAYLHTTRHTTNGIPTGSTYTLMIARENMIKRQQFVQTKKEKIEDLLQYLYENEEDIVVGFVPEYVAIWKANPTKAGFLKVLRPDKKTTLDAVNGEN